MAWIILHITGPEEMVPFVSHDSLLYVIIKIVNLVTSLDVLNSECVMHYKLKHSFLILHIYFH